MRSLRTHRFAAAALLLGVLLPLRVQAQCAPTSGASALVAPASIVFATPAIADFDAGGIVYQSTVTVSVSGRGNRAWNLCLAALTPDLGLQGGVTKPLTDFEWQAAGSGWTPLTFTPQVVTTDRGTQTIVLTVRMRLRWDADPPGTFATTLQFTVGS